MSLRIKTMSPVYLGGRESADQRSKPQEGEGEAEGKRGGRQQNTGWQQVRAEVSLGVDTNNLSRFLVSGMGLNDRTVFSQGRRRGREQQAVRAG